ncbi:helix-turn-helix domain-containing protein [bacterium]|nr:helix-turn-helix domain-containing protein [bacterium]
MTEAEAARRLGFSPKTLRNWRAGSPGRGPRWVTLPTGAVRYTQAALDAWAQGRTVQ